MKSRMEPGRCAAALGLLLLAGCLGRKDPKGGGNAELPPPVAPRPAATPGGERTAPGEEKPKWELPARPGPAVLLRLKRPAGKPVMYEAHLSRQQEGKNRFVETGSFYLTFTSAGQTAEGYDRVAIGRTWLDRNFKETLENGRVQERLLSTTPEYVDLGPNCEMVGNQRCYAFDAQNRVAYRADEEVLLKDGAALRGAITHQDDQTLTVVTPEGTRIVPRTEVAEVRVAPQPHLLQYDTPHYFFPIFSTNPVAPGDTWVFRVPALVPLPQAGGRALLPTQFDVRVVGRLREVRGGGAHQVAVVDYQYAGQFDSAQPPYSARFGPDFLEQNRIRHALDGRGVVEVDVNEGRLLSKEESLVVHLLADSLVVKSASEPAKQDRSWADISSRLTLKLLPPGTRLRSGLAVPSGE